GETAKRALGPHWAQRTPAERDEFVRLFTELVQRTYLSKVDQYNSEMTFQDDVVEGDHAVVRTTLLLGKGSQMALDYRMHRTRDRWQVYDLSIDGISLVASYRSQFNKIVRTDSYEALVARLKSRQVGFAAPAAGPSGGKPGREPMPGRSAPNMLSLTGRLLQRLVQVCCARPALTVVVAFALAALGVGYAAHSLTIETSKFHLLPLHQRYATLYKDYAEDFGQLEDIVVVVQGPAVDTSTAYAARLAG